MDRQLKQNKKCVLSTACAIIAAHDLSTIDTTQIRIEENEEKNQMTSSKTKMSRLPTPEEDINFHMMIPVSVRCLRESEFFTCSAIARVNFANNYDHQMVGRQHHHRHYHRRLSLSSIMPIKGL